MGGRRLTLVLVALTLGALLLASPAALREALARGNFYLFTSNLFTDIPLRLAGPGRLRFLFQPLVASLLGVRDGRADRGAGRRPYLAAFLSGPAAQRALVRSALASIANLVLAAILLDLVFQWILLGVAYPGAAFVVGPVLISLPYALARTLAHLATGTRPAS